MRAIKIVGRNHIFSPACLIDLFHNDVKRGKRDVRRNLIGLKRTAIIAEPIKFRVFMGGGGGGGGGAGGAASMGDGR